MGGNEIKEADELFEPCLPSLTVAIAINGKRESKYVVKWALEKFVTEAKVVFKLIHIRPEITSVPTLMGNSIPISHVREDVAAAYKKEVEWQTSALLLPYTKMCGQRQFLLYVQVDVVVVESDDVANAIAQQVAKYNITKLVIGASARGIFARKVKRHNMSSRISACSPNFCTVYAISKGKLSSVRPSDLKIDASIEDDSSETSCSVNSSSSYTSSSQTELVSVGSYSHFHSPSLPMQRFHALSAINQNLLHSRASSIDANHSRNLSLDIEEERDTTSLCVYSSDIEHAIGGTSSYKGLLKDSQSHVSDQASTSDVHSEHSSSDTQVDINFELEKLRIELRHVRGMYAVAQRETLDASRKINNLNERRSEEAMKLKEITYKEEEAGELARKEMERCEAARMEADYVRECAEKEASQRQEIEMKALRDIKEREKLEKALVGPVHQYQKFTWEEIVSATSSFSESLRIGMGAYGTVYKCSLHQTTAAVKVLHSNENQNNKQFQQELEILSKIRHPHLLILLGACPDRGCLIYEYMENGSLEDRLFRVNGTPSIPWFERYRIAWEVASALVFLHSSKPKPIIHRDLKPANILLDRNFVSRIGDVGLSMVLNSDASYVSTMFKDTAPAGTLCYIDPEYQRTGLISPKSDVYAFGMVILQLLTAKPAVALTHKVETALDDGRLVTILDSEAGNWPIEETKELALLGLNCAELRRRDRPDLKEKVLPVLERLKELADRARDSFSRIQPLPPNHFICPILKDVMNEPCVAADGYTYDRKAIEQWLTDDDKSPITNLPLPNKVLLPNRTLLSAIMDWKSRN
ncbi:U-box domain-containing protein 35-like [Tripterygium wilfordii]|uniref:RING-type E3 ubiquitin transferase n=1 Tax=Tripterygium wilfordii TaxID=458696 RepID=A0A7J7CB08_TRIWF|nr:U-box domain-containing protein 35-like [Tripterygium wilfordii]